MHWYRISGRHGLPWRDTRDPYAVLVSEVMLQQTQVERVIPYYLRWMERWPTVGALAAATPADAIREWAGLGYNRRALYLHNAARDVVQRREGRFPTDIAMLRTLPGVGPYTVAAIASFSFEWPVPVADTNIARVLTRAVLGVAMPLDATPAAIQTAARDLLPARQVREHNLALMDLGATICTARNPRCDGCPLRRDCAWQATGGARSVAPSAPAPRFESTARYARGRVIAALREHAILDEQALASLLPGHHQEQVPKYLAALARDGLIVCAGSGWSLPHESQR